MKKFLSMFLALCATFAFAACGSKDGDGSSSSAVSSAEESSEIVSSEIVSSEEISSESETSEEESSSEMGEESFEEEESSEEEFVPDYDSPTELTEFFDGAMGTVTYSAGRHLTIESLEVDMPIYLGNYDEDNVFTVDGGNQGLSVTVVGGGGGVVQADGGILVFKNLTIKNDTSAFGENGYRDYYAEFGGKVRFENCKIECSIQLRNRAEAEFIDCEINSIATKMYSVWVADGAATFRNCTFTGWRALKTHEELGMDVTSITVEDCFFDNIKEKPGMAIGTLTVKPAETTIIFRNCEFSGCAEWDNVGSEEGVNGFYEADVLTSTLNFIVEGCWVDGVSTDEELNVEFA